MHPDNHKYRRLVDRLPEEMKTLMKHINHECTILAYHAGSMHWSVDFEVKGTRMSLVYERGAMVVLTGTGKMQRSLIPPGKDVLSVSVKDLAREINREFL